MLLLLLPSCLGNDSSQSDSELKIALLESRLAAIQASNASLEEKQNEDKRAMESRLDELQDLIEAISAEPPEEALSDNKNYFGFSYIIEGDGAIITAYSGDATEIIVPASILGNPVTAIADEAFKGSLAVSISVPETVESIGWFAFSSCPRLERIVIPSKVSKIGYGAFDGSSLVKIYTHADSYTAKYAKSYGITIVCD